MKDMIKLKKCPFCGGDAQINTDYNEEAISTGFAYIKCRNCSCRTRSAYVRRERIDGILGFNVRTLEKYEPIKERTGYEELVNLWNTRVGEV